MLPSRLIVRHVTKGVLLLSVKITSFLWATKWTFSWVCLRFSGLASHTYSVAYLAGRAALLTSRTWLGGLHYSRHVPGWAGCTTYVTYLAGRAALLTSRTWLGGLHYSSHVPGWAGWLCLQCTPRAMCAGHSVYRFLNAFGFLLCCHTERTASNCWLILQITLSQYKLANNTDVCHTHRDHVMRL